MKTTKQKLLETHIRSKYDGVKKGRAQGFAVGILTPAVVFGSFLVHPIVGVGVNCFLIGLSLGIVPNNKPERPTFGEYLWD